MCEVMMRDEEVGNGRREIVVMRSDKLKYRSAFLEAIFLVMSEGVWS